MSSLSSATAEPRQSTSRVKQVFEIDQDTMDKIESVFDFVESMRGKLENDSAFVLTAKQACKYIGVSKTTLTQTLRDKIKPIKKVGGLRYLRSDLEAYWLEAQKEGELKTNQLASSTRSKR